MSEECALCNCEYEDIGDYACSVCPNPICEKCRETEIHTCDECGKDMCIDCKKMLCKDYKICENCYMGKDEA